jgi:DeoR/GlpR family transcriptional regulator of sugar metabolism
MKKIILDTGCKTKIAKAFKVSAPTVRKALSFQTHTLLAQKIRGMAIKLGGREITLNEDRS